jgi:eukaryotic-like serine/threonine-protein kinase
VKQSCEHFRRVLEGFEEEATEEARVFAKRHMNECGCCRRQLEARSRKIAEQHFGIASCEEDGWASSTDISTCNGHLRSRFGTYRELARLDAGATATVYRVEDPTGRRLVVKELNAGPAGIERHRECFLRGAREALKIRHENVIAVHEVHDGTRPYLVMDDGGCSLKSLLPEVEPAGSEQRVLETTRAVDIIQQATFGLGAIHAEWIIHRDLKPSNILIDRNERVRITDFGLARRFDPADRDRLTETGEAAGTLDYMSPEQINCKPDLDGRSDIWSLGVVLYELLTGRLPFTAESPTELMRLIAESDPVPPRRLNPRLPYDLETIVLECLRKDPVKRYRDASELVADLMRYRDGRPIEARREGVMEWVSRKRRTNKSLSWSINVIAGLLVVLLVGAAMAGVRQYQLKELALQEQARANRLAFGALIDGGTREADEGDYGATALHWALALTRMQGDREQARVNAIRLATVLEQCPIPFQIWPHPKGVHRFALDKNGRRVAVASHDHRAYVYDTTTGAMLRPPFEHPGPVLEVCFSPDAKCLLTSCRNESRLTPNTPIVNEVRGEGEMRVWDLATGGLVVGPLSLGPLGSVQPGLRSGWIGFVSGGRRLVAVDNAIRVWESKDGRPSRDPIPLHGAAISASLSPDGRHLAVAWGEAIGSRAAVFDLETGGWLIPGWPDRSTEFVAFSPDGQRLLTADYREMHLWEMATLRPVTEAIKVGANLRIRKAAISPNGRLVAAACDDGLARIWDAVTGRPLGEPMRHAQPVTEVAFGPDGSRLLTASEDGRVRIWDAITGQPLGPGVVHADGPVEATFGPDGLSFLTMGPDGCVRLWDAMTFGTWGRAWILPHGADGPVWFNQDGTRVFVPSAHDSQIYDAATGRPVSPRLHHSSKVARAWFSPDGRRVVTTEWTGSFGRIYVWDALAGVSLVPPIERPGMASDVHWRPDGSFLVIASAGNDCSTSEYWGAGRIWEVDPKGRKTRLLAVLEHDRIVNQAVMSCDGRLAATGTGQYDEPGEAAIWSVASGRLVHRPFPHPRLVNSLAFSPDSRLLVTACEDKVARVWDVASGALLRELRHGFPVKRVIFTPDSRHVITDAGSDRQAAVRAWEVATGQPIGRPMIHAPAVTTGPESLAQPALQRIEISRDGRLVLTSGIDGIARVWDLETGKPVSLPMRHRGAVDATISPDGRQVMTVAPAGGDSQGRMIRSWQLLDPRLPASDLFRIAKLKSGRTMDSQGGMMPLDPDEQWEDLRRLREQFPQDFVQAARAKKAWHERQSLRIEDALRRARSGKSTAGQPADPDSPSVALGDALLWHLDHLIELEPEHGKLHFRQGRVRCDLGRRREAVEDFVRASRLMPDRWEVWYNLATCYRARGTMDRSAEAFGKAARLLGEIEEPSALSDKSWFESSAWARLGIVQSRAGRWPEAFDAFSRASAIEPNYNEKRYHYRRGLALAAIERWDMALAEFEKADPDRRSWLSFRERARAWAATRRWGALLADIPVTLAAVHAGRDRLPAELASEEHFAKDLVDLDELQIVSRDDFLAWYRGGYDAGDRIASLSRSIELNPTFWESWFDRGHARARSNQWQLAFADFAKAVELAPDPDEERRKLAFFLLDLGRPKEAMATLKAARGHRPEGPRLPSLWPPERLPALWYDIGRALQEQDDLILAEEAFGEAVKLSPRTPEFVR